LTGPVPTLLRPGLITSAEIEAVVGPILRQQLQTHPTNALPVASPGMMARHYAPRAPLLISADSAELVAELIAANEHVGWLSFNLPGDEVIESLTSTGSGANTKAKPGSLVLVKMPHTAAAYAAVLYARLHELDAIGVTRIVVEELPDIEEWMAIRDRLSRASSQPE
jgi:L-threonylcarbamoyladenylate synthase